MPGEGSVWLGKGLVGILDYHVSIVVIVRAETSMPLPRLSEHSPGPPDRSLGTSSRPPGTLSSSGGSLKPSPGLSVRSLGPPESSLDLQ